jgi:hypothetical protein
MTSIIIETNIEKILEDHLPNEIKLIKDEIHKHQEVIDALFERLTKLHKLAEVLDIRNS